MPDSIKKGRKVGKKRMDMQALEPIPDTFENVIKALVKPVKGKKEEKARGN